MTREQLIAKGWTESPDGVWRKSDARAVGALGAKEPKRLGPSARQNSQLGPSARRLGYRITIIQVRRHGLDRHDNLRTAVKPLVDRITESLGYASDNDPRLAWEYGQCETDGEPGIIVKIVPDALLTMATAFM